MAWMEIDKSFFTSSQNGFPRFRWYSYECAKAITSWGRQYIKRAMKKAEDYGFYAIYADTDGFYAKYKK